MLNKKKVFIFIVLPIIIIIAIVGFVIIKNHNAEKKQVNTGPINEDNIDKYANVLNSEGVAELLINDDLALEFVMKNVAMYNLKQASGENYESLLKEFKLYLSLLSIIDVHNSTADENSNPNATDEIPKVIVELAYKELFGNENIEYMDAFNYHYDDTKELFIKNGENENNTIHIHKINKMSPNGNIKEIEYLYYSQEPGDDNLVDNDCYKTVVKVQTNNQYSFSKYKIIDADDISYEVVGKVGDNV